MFSVVRVLRVRRFMRVLSFLLFVTLFGCTHKLQLGQPEVPEKFAQSVAQGFERHEQMLQAVIVSVGEVREKLQMNEGINGE